MLNNVLQPFLTLAGMMNSGARISFAKKRGGYYVSTPHSSVRAGDTITVGFLAGDGHTVADYVAAYEAGSNKFLQAVETRGQPQGTMTFQFVIPGKYFFKYLVSPCEERARSRQIEVSP